MQTRRREPRREMRRSIQLSTGCSTRKHPKSQRRLDSRSYQTKESCSKETPTASGGQAKTCRQNASWGDSFASDASSNPPQNWEESSLSPQDCEEPSLSPEDRDETSLSPQDCETPSGPPQVSNEADPVRACGQSASCRSKLSGGPSSGCYRAQRRQGEETHVENSQSQIHEASQVNASQDGPEECADRGVASNASCCPPHDRPESVEL